MQGYSLQKPPIDMNRASDLVNRGVVVSVRGSVVDIRFDEHLPPIYSVLRTGAERQIVIEVLAQLDARRVRGIALTPTQGLARGMAVDGHGRTSAGAGGQGHPLAHVRCLRQHHRPRSAPSRCPVAFCASGAAAAGTTFHQVRDLRNRHQDHRRADAAGTWRQGGPVRRGGRGQDRACSPR